MRRLVVPIACAFGAAAVSLAAAQAPPSSPQRVPVFRAGVNVVQLDVTVLDEHRRPVRGLTADDFSLTVGGRPEPIVAFTPIDLPQPDRDASPWARDVSPDVVGNTGDLRRIVLVVMDDANTQSRSVSTGNARRIGREAIASLGPSDLAAVVYTYSGRAQEFTADRVRLFAAVDAFLPRYFVPIGPGSSKFFAGPPLACRVMATLGGCSVDMLQHVADVLASAPAGRKIVIYVGSIPIPPFDDTNPDASDQLPPSVQMLRALQRANVTVYTFDPEGVGIDPPSPSVRTLAEQTGGRATVGVGAPWEGVAQVFEENRAYYLIGLNGDALPSTGASRSVRVRVNRPGLEVRSRASIALPAPIKTAAAPPAEIDVAIARGLPTGDLPIQVSALPFGVAGAKDADVAVVARIIEPAAAPDPAGSGVRSVRMVATAIDATGRSHGAMTQTVDITRRAGATGDGAYEIVSHLPLRPGTYQVRFAAESGAHRGSVVVDVDVPDFAKAPVALSGLVLQRVPSWPIVPSTGLAPLVPVVPTTARAFAPTDRVTAFARIYQGGKDALKTVALAWRIVSTNDRPRLEERRVLDPKRFSTDRAADDQLDLPLADLVPGEYLLTVEVTLGKAQARRDVRFTVR